MAENIGDGSIYLRLQGLKEGTVQYTDTSNASGLCGNTAWISGTMRHGKNGSCGMASIGSWMTVI
ncbi:hypothetical protein AGMMS50268_38310 [Spirochaetia bacterium]|nr:hypothetical protein AGMMS50268_38310 [Spirochaetia bacterium]